MRWLMAIAIALGAVLWMVAGLGDHRAGADEALVARSDGAAASPGPVTAVVEDLERIEIASPDPDGAILAMEPRQDWGSVFEPERRTLVFRPWLPDGTIPESVAFELVGVDRRAGTSWQGTVAVVDGVARLSLEFLPRPLAEMATEGGPFEEASLRLARTTEQLSFLAGYPILEEQGVFGAVMDLAEVDRVLEGVVDLGRVELARPGQLGTVTFEGTWTPRARLSLLSRRAGGKLQGTSDPVVSDRVVVTTGPQLSVWSFASSEEWSVTAWPRGALPPGAGLLPPSRMGSFSVSGSGRRGETIRLALPFRSGLDLSVDLLAAPRAGRLVILAAGADPAPMSAGATLGRDAYNERIGAAVWTNVVPRGPVKKGKASYDIGKTDLPEGPLRLELWSIDDEQDVRELLAARSVSAGSDMLRVSLP